MSESKTTLLQYAQILTLASSYVILIIKLQHQYVVLYNDFRSYCSKNLN